MERISDPVNTPDTFVPAPDPPARRRAAHTPWRRRRALQLLVEGGVIAVSVFLSLWADQWREDRNGARDGDSSLRRIVGDLQKEGANLTRAAHVSDMGVAAITGVLTSPSSGITLDSVAVLIPWVMLSQVYRPSAEEYAGLRGAGRLGIISNQELACGEESGGASRRARPRHRDRAGALTRPNHDCQGTEVDDDRSRDRHR